jgi:hemin uptake protein HemP
MSETQDKTIEAMPPRETLHLPALELSSQELFRNGNTVRIEHAGQTYWLRLTRGNKLILTK